MNVEDILHSDTIMAAFIMNGVKYMSLLDDNELKLKSLNDWVYYTLRDIFWNVYEERHIMKASELNETLIINGKYTDALNEPPFLNKLYAFLMSIDDAYFKFSDSHFNGGESYMEYSLWWKQYKDLCKKIGELRKKD